MKLKKIKETRKKISNNYDMVTTAYTEHPEGELKVKIMPPVEIKIDDETSKKKEG